LLTQQRPKQIQERRNKDRGEIGHQRRRNRKMLLRETTTSATERNRRKIQTRTEKIKK
jgi:hypothetical protein